MIFIEIIILNSAINIVFIVRIEWNVITSEVKMSRRSNRIFSIGRALLTYTAIMMIQNGLQPNVEAANILSKYKNGYNVNKVGL